MFSLERSGRRRFFPIEGFASKGSRPLTGVGALSPSILGGLSPRRPWSASPISRSTPDLSYGGALGSTNIGSSSPYSPVLRPSNLSARPTSAANGQEGLPKTLRGAPSAQERLKALLADRPTSGGTTRSASSRPTSAISVGIRTLGGPSTSRPASSSKSVDYRPGIRTN